MKLSFTLDGDFLALYAAEAWCAEQGVSVGRAQGPAPRGLLYGDFDIQKWRNLSPADIAALDGHMTGNLRHGPVHIEILTRAEAEARALRLGIDATLQGA